MKKGKKILACMLSLVTIASVGVSATTPIGVYAVETSAVSSTVDFSSVNYTYCNLLPDKVYIDSDKLDNYSKVIITNDVYPVGKKITLSSFNLMDLQKKVTSSKNTTFSCQVTITDVNSKNNSVYTCDVPYIKIDKVGRYKIDIKFVDNKNKGYSWTNTVDVVDPQEFRKDFISRYNTDGTFVLKPSVLDDAVLDKFQYTGGVYQWYQYGLQRGTYTTPVLSEKSLLTIGKVKDVILYRKLIGESDAKYTQVYHSSFVPTYAPKITINATDGKSYYYCIRMKTEDNKTYFVYTGPVKVISKMPIMYEDYSNNMMCAGVPTFKVENGKTSFKSNPFTSVSFMYGRTNGIVNFIIDNRLDNRDIATHRNDYYAFGETLLSVESIPASDLKSGKTNWTTLYSGFIPRNSRGDMSYVSRSLRFLKSGNYTLRVTELSLDKLESVKDKMVYYYSDVIVRGPRGKIDLYQSMVDYFGEDYIVSTYGKNFDKIVDDPEGQLDNGDLRLSRFTGSGGTYAGDVSLVCNSALQYEKDKKLTKLLDTNYANPYNLSAFATGHLNDIFDGYEDFCGDGVFNNILIGSWINSATFEYDNPLYPQTLNYSPFYFYIDVKGDGKFVPLLDLENNDPTDVYKNLKLGVYTVKIMYRPNLATTFTTTVTNCLVAPYGFWSGNV